MTSHANISAPFRALRCFISALMSDLKAISTPPPYLLYLFGSLGSSGCVILDLSFLYMLSPYRSLLIISRLAIEFFNQVSLRITISGLLVSMYAFNSFITIV